VGISVTFTGRQEAEGNLVLSYSSENEYSMNKTNKQNVPLRCHLDHVLIPTELLLRSIPADQIGNFVSFRYKPRSGLSYGPYSTPFGDLV